MREKGTPSKLSMTRSMAPKKEPERFFHDKILRDKGYKPNPIPKSPDPGTAPGRFQQRDDKGRVIRALSGIMTKGNLFRGTF